MLKTARYAYNNMTCIIQHSGPIDSVKWQHSFVSYKVKDFRIGERVLYKNKWGRIVAISYDARRIVMRTDNDESEGGNPQEFIPEPFVSLIYNPLYNIHISLN